MSWHPNETLIQILGAFNPVSLKCSDPGALRALHYARCTALRALHCTHLVLGRRTHRPTRRDLLEKKTVAHYCLQAKLQLQFPCALSGPAGYDGRHQCGNTTCAIAWGT